MGYPPTLVIRHNQFKLVASSFFTCFKWVLIFFFYEVGDSCIEIIALACVCLQFIDGRLELLNSGEGFSDQFEEEINMGEYAGKRLSLCLSVYCTANKFMLFCAVTVFKFACLCVCSKFLLQAVIRHISGFSQ